eukprot:m.167587 g.167587  ORF g.167587 m.167587 type:complete len:213 (+) comp53173_c0_seq8:107-745(+)
MIRRRHCLALVALALLLPQGLPMNLSVAVLELVPPTTEKSGVPEQLFADLLPQLATATPHQQEEPQHALPHEPLLPPEATPALPTPISAEGPAQSPSLPLHSPEDPRPPAEGEVLEETSFHPSGVAEPQAATPRAEGFGVHSLHDSLVARQLPRELAVSVLPDSPVPHRFIITGVPESGGSNLACEPVSGTRLSPTPSISVSCFCLNGVLFW